MPFSVDLSLAISGSTLSQVPQTILNSKPELPSVVLLMRGLNDLIGRTSTDIPTFMGHLVAAIDVILAAGATTIVVGTVPPFSSVNNGGFREDTQQLILDVNDAIRTFVASSDLDLILIDIYPLLDLDGDNFTDLQFRNAVNDIHLNELGSEQIANELISIFNDNFSC